MKTFFSIRNHKKYYLFLALFLFYFIWSCKQDNAVDPITEQQNINSIVPNVEDIVMYEINIRAFSDDGSFNGISARLDSIKALGVNVIWLMPIHPVGVLKSVGQLGSPYSVKDYNLVNPEFGSLNDFKNLLNKSHALGISVILDWVANHTSWDNPWIANKNWYTQDGSGNIISPAGTGWKDVADLNFENSQMRLEMIKAMKYWAEIGVDGFRCDAADYVPYTFWKQAIDSLKKFPKKKFILLAEGSRSDHFSAGFQMNYAWEFYSMLKNVFRDGNNASFLYSTHQTEISKSSTGKKLRFTTNHDESAWDNPPPVIFKNTKGALAASVASIFMGGVPLIYSSQEVGYPNKLPFFSRTQIDWNLNPDMKSEYKKLLNLYNTNQILKKGSITNYSNFDVVAFTKTFDSKDAFTIINTRNQTVSYSIPQTFQNVTWRNQLTNTAFKTESSISLQPFQYLILAR